MSELLYLIVPYFNFTGSSVSFENLNIFLKKISIFSNVRVVIAEGYLDKRFKLEDLSNQVFKHLKIEFENQLWIKENLINIAFNSLGDWQYGCWVDKDIQFINPNWVSECVEKLKICDIVQPYSNCIYLDEKFKFSEENNAFFFEKSGKKINQIVSFCKLICERGNLSYGCLGHEGNVWAINRNFYNKINGIYDKCIIGGGDSFLASCISQKNNFSNAYFKKDFINYSKNFIGVKVGYIEGLILHHYHGEMKNRNYINRFELFHKYGFNVDEHLRYINNKISLADSGKKFECLIEKYFTNRNY